MRFQAKVILAWAGVFAFRLLPLRAPNVEPLMATIMPFSKRLGVLGSFAFAFLSIVLFDLVTSGIGSWTWITAFAYGAVGLASALYFRFRPASRADFVGFGIGATLFYDAVTGLLPGPLLGEQTFAVALYGQIPFTMLHLLGTIVFAALLSPVLERWLAAEGSFVIHFATSEARAR